MTKLEQKLQDSKTEWLASATNDQVLSQLDWAVFGIENAESDTVREQAKEDYKLIVAEIRKRMN